MAIRHLRVCNGLVAKHSILAKTASEITWNKCEFYAYCTIKFKRHRISGGIWRKRHLSKASKSDFAPFGELLGCLSRCDSWTIRSFPRLEDPRSIRKSWFLLGIWARLRSKQNQLCHVNPEQIWQKNDRGNYYTYWQNKNGTGSLHWHGKLYSPGPISTATRRLVAHPKSSVLRKNMLQSLQDHGTKKLCIDLLHQSMWVWANLLNLLKWVV